MSKNNIIIALVVLCLVGTIWGSVQDKKSKGLERQLAAMKEQSHDTVAQSEGVENKAVSAEIEKLKAEKKNLQKDAEALKGKVSSQLHELASLKKELAEADNSEALALLQAQRGQRATEIRSLEDKIMAIRSELYEKANALATAEETIANTEEMKGSLANSIDACSAKNHELFAELNNAAVRVASLENALEERTKLLIAKGAELSRTQLNMNVLLSKIAAQNNSLAILEETRVALEHELSRNFLTIEELQHQLSAQVVKEELVGETAAEEQATVH